MRAAVVERRPGAVLAVHDTAPPGRRRRRWSPGLPGSPVVPPAPTPVARSRRALLRGLTDRLLHSQADRGRRYAGCVSCSGILASTRPTALKLTDARRVRARPDAARLRRRLRERAARRLPAVARLLAAAGRRHRHRHAARLGGAHARSSGSPATGSASARCCSAPAGSCSRPASGSSPITAFVPLLVVAVVGTLNPSAGDVSVFLPTEQAFLAGHADAAPTAPACTRIYNVGGNLAGALRRRSLSAVDHRPRVGFLVYVAVAVIAASRLPGPARRTSRAAVRAHAAARAIAARSCCSSPRCSASTPAGGGLVVQSLLVLWLHLRSTFDRVDRRGVLRRRHAVRVLAAPRPAAGQRASA